MLSEKFLPDKSRDGPSGISHKTMECGILNDPKKKKSAKTSLVILYKAITFCFIFMSAEFVAGYISNSVAIYSDAIHMFSDVVGFLFNICGLRLTLKTASSSYTYGYYRVEIFAACLSIFLLWVILAVLCVEAAGRVSNPPPVDGKVMVITACLGMLTNIILAFILTREDGNDDDDDVTPDQETIATPGGSGESDESPPKKKAGNISVESALTHAIGDLVQNVGVLVAGSMIWYDKKYFLLDPICTFVFALIVLFGTMPIVYSSIYALMETAPKSVDSILVRDYIKNLKYVKKLNDMHIWSINHDTSVLTAQVEIACTCRCVPVSKVREQITKIAEKRHIHHCNIEITVVPLEERAEITSRI